MSSAPRPAGIPAALADRWLQYVDALHRGLRKDALKVLDVFIEDLESHPNQVRDAFCAWLCAEALDRRHGYQSWHTREVPLQHPLSWRVLRPYFESAYRRRLMPALRWLYQYPDWELHRAVVAAVDGQAAAGNFQQAILQRALSVAPDDPALWSLRFQSLVGALDYGSHHLGEGHGFVDGTDEEYQALLQEGRDVLESAPPGALDRQDVADFEEQARMYQDWFDYVQADPDESFEQWCQQRGHAYQFPKAYYYGPG